MYHICHGQESVEYEDDSDYTVGEKAKRKAKHPRVSTTQGVTSIGDIAIPKGYRPVLLSGPRVLNPKK